ncbi:hypothetical protein MJG53_003159 [Ovis ammon polii x Ovis aries]|uniref:Uncharacterized protein n=1 Tax=Ovis ammon polii x Ovis aries TaxID=2918886 RepID=A0ACB9VFJ0_9CETA|nr:hypothetical protein MJG53_003159 [Ovis ammon polii x Ovis aries]
MEKPVQTSLVHAGGGLAFQRLWIDILWNLRRRIQGHGGADSFEGPAAVLRIQTVGARSAPRERRRAARTRCWRLGSRGSRAAYATTSFARCAGPEAFGALSLLGGSGLVKGDTAASLPIISYSLTSYSPYVAELLVDSNVELLAKNDLRFIDTVYKLLRDQFNYKPILTKKQFIQCGFAEWKIQIICDILNCVMKKHKELSSLEKTPSQQRKKTSSAKSEPCSSAEKTSTEPVGIDVTGRYVTSGKKKAVVIRHLYNEDGADISEDTVTDVNEAFDVCDLKAAEITIPELQVPDINCEQQDIKVNPEVAALQSMLAECQEKLKKLTCIESRLESLEEKMKGKVMVNEKTWANLLSRVTLLETEMLLSKKNNEYIEFNEMSEDYASSSDMDSLNPDRKSKEERHANIPLSFGYSTVSSNSTPRTSTVNYCGLKEISEESFTYFTIPMDEQFSGKFEDIYDQRQEWSSDVKCFMKTETISIYPSIIFYSYSMNKVKIFLAYLDLIDKVVEIIPENKMKNENDYWSNNGNCCEKRFALWTRQLSTVLVSPVVPLICAYYERKPDSMIWIPSTAVSSQSSSNSMSTVLLKYARILKVRRHTEDFT